MRGYYGIGIENVKTPCNIGGLWRSAHAFGANFIFTIGNRYKTQKSDTSKAPKHIPLYEYSSFEEFYRNIPREAELVGIDCNITKARSLRNFVHPERAVYLLGAEDWGLSGQAKEFCKHLICIDTNRCLNVSTAGSIIMYDRSVLYGLRL